LVCPSAAGPALATLETTGDAAFNSAWSLAGNPAITLPLFKASESGLPIGCQFIAGTGNDDTLLAASKTIMNTFAPG
jgi:Asp-tRNA(Asn)/Glu-tRNA(Gln) amidotransferase A subunit family amidase